MDSTVAAHIVETATLPWASIACALALSWVFPAPALYCISNALWHRIARGSNWSRADALGGHRSDLPAFVGIVERILVTFALMLGYPSFIGLWLGTKVAGSWEGWSKGYEKPEGKGYDGKGPRDIHGRHLFNAFLVSAGISLLWAASGAAYVALQPAHLAAAWVQMGVLAVLTYGFALYLWLTRA